MSPWPLPAGVQQLFPWPAYRLGVAGAGTRQGVTDVADASPAKEMAADFYEDRRQITGFANGTSAGGVAGEGGRGRSGKNEAS